MPVTTVPSRPRPPRPGRARPFAPRTRRGRVLGPAAAAGVLVALSVPPWGVWPLGLAGLGLLAWRISGLPARSRALAGFAAGLVWYLATLAWMSQFNLAGGVLAAVGEAGFVALACAATPVGPRRGPGSAGLLAFPAALVLAEAVVARWPFGGEPLGDVALGQAAGPLAQAARVGGPLLVIGLAGAAGVVVARAGRRTSAVLVFAVVAVTSLAGAAPDGGRPVRILAVAAVQGGGRRGLHRLERDPGVVFRAQVEATSALVGPVDLVVWPENVIDLDGPLVGSPEAGVVSDLARRLRATVVAGVTEPAGDTHFRNAVVAWGPDGQILARYEKVRRVPFGEYVPLRSLVRHVVHLELVPRDALPGRGPNVLATPAGRLGALISYEVFFADRDRAALRHGAQLILVPTNAASFTTTQVPTQEVAAARLRAIEGGRDVVQVAPTGYSALIGNWGQVRSRSTLGRSQVVSGVVSLRRGRTTYARTGDLPVLGLSVVVLAALAALAGEDGASRLGGLRRPSR